MKNCIDLFAGCGGLSDGFKQSNFFNLVAAVEWDKNASQTLVNRLEKKWGYVGASSLVINFDMQRTNELLSGFDNEPVYGKSQGLVEIVGGRNVDVIIGGPPCQAYSVAGRIRDENAMEQDYRNYLFESYLKIVEYFKPKACIFENVPGMLSASPGGIPIIDRIKEAFKLVGYSISQRLKEDALLDTSEFGVPQKRLRVIIIAVRDDSFINPEKSISLFYDYLNMLKEPKKSTVSDVLGDLPLILPLKEPTSKMSHYVKNSPCSITSHEPRFHNQRDISIFRLLAKDIESGENKYTSTEELKKLYTEKTGKKSELHKYHVLRKDQPSNTITAHLHKDGLRHIHPDPIQARTITVREAARLQSFDDDFIFLGANGAKYKMIGNAVPPKFAKKVAIALHRVIGGF